MMSSKKLSSRRQFLENSLATGIVAATMAGLSTSNHRVHAAENNVLKIGLVGCGSRGRGAVQNAMAADSNIRLVAIGDAFPENAANALAAFQKDKNIGSKIDVTPETCFDGLECYKKVVDACDVVLLCEPSHFRPISLRYAIEKGKHAFAEKPVAVDGAGVKSVLETAKLAKEKKLNILSGLCWRYDNNVREIMKRVLGGDIGNVRSTNVSYLTNRLWTRPKKENDTEMMFQVRNWYNFSWLSGDFNVEQAIHSVDKMLWSFGDQVPVAAYGVGGRMARVEQPAYGDIYDSMGVYYDFGDGKTGYLFCRQMNQCFNETWDLFTGSTGYARTFSGGFKGGEICPKGSEAVKVSGPASMYVDEHREFFKAIRSGGETYINNGEYMANSTMAGIMGRLVCYTGKRLTWQEAIDMEVPVRPSGYTWDATPPTLPDENGRYKVEVPGEGLVYHQVSR